MQWRQVAAIPGQLQHVPSAGDGEDRRHAVRVVRRHQDADQALSRSCTDGYDRDTGEGVGHLFKLDLKGNLITDLTLGEGSIYHPGGIDYDGKWIWVPAAEYRPNSRAIIYRVDPAAMKATEVFRYGDHIGGLVHNTENKTLHGVSWGSRRFYTLDARRRRRRDQRQDAAGATARRQSRRATSTIRIASISGGRRRCAPASTITR